MDTIMPLAIVLIVLLTITGIIVLIVNAFRNKDKGMQFNSKLLLRLYLYFISYITLFISTFGLIMVLKAGLSYAVEFPFSYRLNTYYEAIPVQDGANQGTDQIFKPIEDNRDIYVKDGNKYYVDYNERKMDIVNGTTLFISMIALFAIHKFSIRFVEDKESVTSIKRAYHFGSLILYSLIGIISIPVAIYQLLNYFVIYSDKFDDYSRPVPGEPVAFALVITPLWLLFLYQFIKIQRKEKDI